MIQDWCIWSSNTHTHTIQFWAKVCQNTFSSRSIKVTSWAWSLLSHPCHIFFVFIPSWNPRDFYQEKHPKTHTVWILSNWNSNGCCWIWTYPQKMECKFRMQRIAFTFFTPEISMFSPATVPDSDPCAWEVSAVSSPRRTYAEFVG